MMALRMSEGSAYATFDHFGEPEEVLRVDTGAVHEPVAGEVCVQVVAAPVNPADINYIQGVYGERPTLPQARPGLEGYGVVVKSRDPAFAEGDHVILLHGAGSWGTYLTAPAASFLRISSTLDPLQAAMLKVNPLTAWLVLTAFSRLRPGDWVVQNAANSGVGQCLIQLAHSMGLHTINLVRHASERIALLKSLGADVVVEDAPEAVAAALEETGG